MKSIPFESFNAKFSGQSCWVVGRGPTLFDYEELRSIPGPVFFINDSVSLESKVSGESFFFAHDESQRCWLSKPISSVAVIPLGGKIIQGKDDPCLHPDLNVCFYKWQTMEGESLLRLPRDRVADLQQLYRNTGTMHSLIHFLWFCAFKKVYFVGCDGFNHGYSLWHLIDIASGYDKRLPNVSDTAPWWQYTKIRWVQDRLCSLLGLETEFLGTPSQSPPKTERRPLGSCSRTIPRIAHFVWIGGALPASAERTLRRFREFHPHWDVRLWSGVPAEIPAEIVEKIYQCPWICMRCDIIRAWLLQRYGGIYSDLDIHYLRPIDVLRETSMFVPLEKSNLSATNCVLGSIPNGEFMNAVMDHITATTDLSNSRTTFGPDLYSKLAFGGEFEVTLLPEHYFCPFRFRNSALRFAADPEAEQLIQIEKLRERMIDEQSPFGVHLQGIPPSEMEGGIQSSFTTAVPLLDKLLVKLHGKTGNGLVLSEGVQIRNYLKGHNPQLDISSVTTLPAPHGVPTSIDWIVVEKNFLNTIHDIKQMFSMPNDSEGFEDESMLILLKTTKLAAEMYPVA